MRSLRLFIIALLIIFILSDEFLPARYRSHYPRELGPEFMPQIRQDWREKLEAQKSNVILMGDSVLFEGINPVMFEELTGQKPLFVAIPGSSSALWYAITKNNIVTAAASPQFLFLFFRDTMLTTPDFRVSGKYFTMLDEFASPQDTLIVQKAYTNSMNWSEQFLEHSFPLYGNRTEVRNSLDYRLKYTVLYRLLGCGEVCVDEAIADVFADDKKIAGSQERAVSEAEEYLYERKNLNFERQLPRSFLPDMLSILKERNIQLVLVQVKTTKFEPEDRPARLNRYMASLEKFARENDIIYLSFADDARLDAGFFVDEIHLTDQGQALFTVLFSDEVNKLLSAPPET